MARPPRECQLVKELAKLAAGVSPAIEEAARRRSSMMKGREVLKRAGLLSATPFWVSGRYMYLRHVAKPGKKRRTSYVGSDEAKCTEALEQIKRYRQDKELEQAIKNMDLSLESARRALELFYAALVFEEKEENVCTERGTL